MKRHSVILLTGIALLASSCTLAPKYSRPEGPVPDQWPQGPAYAASQPATAPTDVTQLKWQEFFLDPKLLRVVQTALENNRDLRLAALNVERVGALYDIQRAELAPTVDAGATFTRARLPADLSGTGQPRTGNVVNANVFVSSWELDFFGRIRSLTARALQEYLASEEARRSAQILLISQVAGAYLNLAADQETLELAQTTLTSQQAAYDLVQRRLDHGLVPELDLYRAQTQVDAARVDVARLTQLVAQDRNALDLLAGAPVPEELLPTELGSSDRLQEVSPGISSAVLLRRPDIMGAEDVLKGAYANIGAARAALFPRIALTGAVGTGSNELSGLFKPGSMAWNFSPQATMPIFDLRAWSALKVTKVDRKSAVAQYEKTIQAAFREVADTLAVCGTVDQQIAAQEALVFASQETYRLATARYTKGVDSYLSVLDAQQSLYSAQQRLVALRLAKLANLVRLYAVLGGGADLSA